MPITYLDDSTPASSKIQYLDEPEMGGKPSLSFVADQVSKLAPWNRASQGLRDVAGYGAEKLGAAGVPPKIAAGAMLPVAMAPDLLAAGTTIGAIEKSPEPLARAIRNTPRDLSPEYDALFQKAGISKNLPEAGGRVARFPNLAGQASKVPPPFAPAIAPMNYPRDTNALLNFSRARMEGLGDRLSPQELNDYRTLIGQLIDTGKVGSGTPLAMASQLRAQATDLLNSKVEGLSDLNKVYALSKKLRIAPEVAKKVWDYVGPKMRWGSMLVP